MIIAKKTTPIMIGSPVKLFADMIGLMHKYVNSYKFLEVSYILEDSYFAELLNDFIKLSNTIEKYINKSQYETIDTLLKNI